MSRLRKAPVKAKRKPIKKVENNPRKGTKIVCARCGADWHLKGNPGRCPDCHEISYGISVKLK